MISDPLVMPIARALLACLVAEKASGDWPEAPDRIGLRPGSIVDHLLSTAGDDECCAGLAWVRPAALWPASGQWPEQDGAPLAQGPRAWAVQLELGAVRCAPTPPHDAIPTEAQWDTTTQAVMDDAAALRRALCCYVEQSPTRWSGILPGLWQPIPVSGGCVGGVLPVTILGPVCDC